MDAPADAQLATVLDALASPTRLALIRALRAPKTLTEIELRPPDGPAGGRPLARQTVREHLDRLIQAGMVMTREVERSYGLTVEFQVNHQTAYALAEEMRSMARLRPALEPEMATVHRAHAPPRPIVGPALVVVKGLDEGASFDLRPDDAKKEWVIGRRRNAEVALDFDPFVSSDNSRIRWDGDAHQLEDMPGSRNGTTHNFSALASGETRTLRHGDVVGVGRSYLLYWR